MAYMLMNVWIVLLCQISASPRATFLSIAKMRVLEVLDQIARGAIRVVLCLVVGVKGRHTDDTGIEKFSKEKQMWKT